MNAKDVDAGGVAWHSNRVGWETPGNPPSTGNYGLFDTVACISHSDCSAVDYCSANTCVARASCYEDSDSDTYGNETYYQLVAASSCAAFSGWVADNNDCNDNDPSINPDGTESCNGVDDDCNHFVDDTAGTCLGLTPECLGTIVCSDFAAASCPSICTVETIPGRCSITGQYCYDDTDCPIASNTCEGEVDVCGGGSFSCTRFGGQGACEDSALNGGACTWTDDTCDATWSYDLYVNPSNPSLGCSGSAGLADNCAWTCDGSYPPENKCGDNQDNDGVNGIDCFDLACQANNAANTITAANIENYNCLGTTYNGTHETGIPNDGTNYTSDYYCGEINATESGVGEPVGLCCPSGQTPRFDPLPAPGKWYCGDFDPCRTTSGGLCDYDYDTVNFVSWSQDAGCLDMSQPSACCSVINLGAQEYWSNTDNIKIY